MTDRAAAGPVLVLGGTAEARALAHELQSREAAFLSSLAGRVQRPRLPVGEVRIGGFGGAEGLAAFIRERGVAAVVDATHPFAATMSANAARACALTRTPLVRLARPGWGDHPDAASWTWVGDHDEARTAAESLGERPFLTTGRQTLGHYAAWSGREVLVRVVERLDEPPPARWTVVLDRGPYAVEGELALLREHRIDVLLTKDSGGSYTAAKLDAARALGMPVVVIGRPAPVTGVAEVDSVAAVLSALSDAGVDVGPAAPA
ncbi:cobalt-precorrin-6A reductase [Nostocoides sp. HKS02]|uniref:cobalt-precorrin-6A reductase n=1 Tax=Nostocoides sp. HKS02 TaxID=1813880 RepID=UPI0012B49A7A|nr:cobalt-precorrin-6A reductase [Tetrasphaera sp. HKS02]QGN58141.1 cobalt-precorrin-6A reductase [Tetrasphaera sp. HKS02]